MEKNTFEMFDNKILPKDTYINKKEFGNKIVKECNEHKIRLTPEELEQVVATYINRFVENIDIPTLISISEIVAR